MTEAAGRLILKAGLVLTCGVLLAGCGTRGSADSAAGAPAAIPVEHEGDGSVVHVAHPEQFALATATARNVAPELRATGVVSPDVSRSMPVASLASGRVIDLRTRLGDRVTKGQLLLRIQSADASEAFADYRKALADQTLAAHQLGRANALYARGAIAQKDEEVAQDTADKARIDAENARERLHVLGLDADRPPTAIVDVVAPTSGIVTEQNITNAAGVKSLDNSPNLLTISDLSRVWIVCDVYENDLPAIRVGDTAQIRLAAYPDRLLTGRIGDIGPILDPAIRAAKVRVEVANPGFMRIGMFVTATFHGQATERRAVVPATAVLHLHDRDWVYVAAGAARFERKAVVSGSMLPGGMQELLSGLEPGQTVVSNALVFQNTVEQ